MAATTLFLFSVHYGNQRKLCYHQKKIRFKVIYPIIFHIRIDIVQFPCKCVSLDGL